MALDIQTVKSTLDEKLERTRVLYEENHIDEAGKIFGDILPIIVNSLLSEAGIVVDDSDDSYISKIDALNGNGIISEEETKRLTKMRKIRNNFIHYYDIMMGNNEEQKQQLQRDVRNFKKHIAFTEDCIKWFVEKAENPAVTVGVQGNSKGTQNPHSDFGRNSDLGPFSNLGLRRVSDNYSEVPAAGTGIRSSSFPGLLVSYIPFIICTLIGMGIHLLFDKPQTGVYLEKLVNGNQMPIWIGFLTFLTLMFILFFEVSFPAATGVAFALMTWHITNSDVATLLGCMTGVLLTVGLSERLRRTMSIITYSVIVFVGLFITWDILKHKQIDKGVVLDGYNIVIKMVLPIVGFLAAALIIRLTIARNFRLCGAFLEGGVPMHMVVAAVPAAILGFMYRSEWVKGIALLTRNFYDSKLIFWTIHIALFLIVFKIYDVLVESGRIAPVNLFRVFLRVFAIFGILFALFAGFLRRSAYWWYP